MPSLVAAAGKKSGGGVMQTGDTSGSLTAQVFKYYRGMTMKISNLFLAAALSTALFAGGCAKKENPLDKAVDSTKDALDMRDHEKLKDAAEGARDAAKDAAEGVKDAAKDVTSDIKGAAQDAKDAVKDSH